MTDLLGTLNTLHAAVNAAGGVRIARTSVDGMAGVVDRETNTIHINPDLGLDEWLATLAEGLKVIARRGDPFGMEGFDGPITADGARVIPMRPYIRPVPDS